MDTRVTDQRQASPTEAPGIPGTIEGPRETDRPAFHRCKRAIDVVGAASLLLVLLPVLGLIAAAIWVESPGPIVFVQPRVGSRRHRGGGRARWKVQVFSLYKFRTMRRDADTAVHQAHIRSFVLGQIPARPSGERSYKVPDDPRVTRVGRLLRRSSLDELPQLINVLKGDMSLVGPRPVPVYEAAHYKPAHLERLAARPGLTGLWQVRGRSRLSFEEMIRLDVDYVRRQSLSLDFRVLLTTIPVVLSGRGAR